jgi:hypothetical protein
MPTARAPAIAGRPWRTSRCSAAASPPAPSAAARRRRCAYACAFAAAADFTVGFDPRCAWQRHVRHEYVSFAASPIDSRKAPNSFGEFDIADLALRGALQHERALHSDMTHISGNYDWWDRALTFEVAPGRAAFDRRRRARRHMQDGGVRSAMSDRTYTLDDFACGDPREFVDIAYRTIVGRSPTPAERERMLETLVTGGTRTYALGALRYGREGRARGVAVAGLRSRYLAQRLFRLPVLGAAFGWLSALVRLPRTLRYSRRVETGAAPFAAAGTAFGGPRCARTQDGRWRAQACRCRPPHRRRNATRPSSSARWPKPPRASVERLAELDRRALELQQRVDAIHPPPLDATMAVTGEPLTPLARERGGIAPGVALGTLSAHARYALFETVFYDSRAVAAKQRVYIDYVDCELAKQAPFVDLGCGRGEFLHILQELGIEAIGVDINADVVRRLRTEGFTVVEQDLLAFLEGERRMFCGASVLQVAEDLTAEQIERLSHCSRRGSCQARR